MPEVRVTHLRISRRGLAGLAALVLLPWVFVLWLARERSTSPSPVLKSTPAATAAAPAPAPGSGWVALAPGPWGNLQSTRIVIEPPEDYVPTGYIKPDALRWIFKGYSPATLDALWQRAGLSTAQRQVLAEATKVERGAIAIDPSPEFIIGLTPQARATIYVALAEFPENHSQNEPYRLRADAATEWFAESGLSPEILDLTKRLLYERNGNVFFADDDVVLPRIASTTERVQFIKTLSRKSTQLVQLVVGPDTSAEAIARYWGRGRRSKDIEPLIQSLVRKPGGGAIDIVHLVPRFPRSLLYTYPLASEKPEDAAHDCHWAAFNFFNDIPDERFANIDFVRETLLNRYYPVAGAPTFGDLVVLVRADGTVVHSCVYLAADVVFTKNGAAYSVPWMLGNLDSIVAFYSISSPVEVRRYRLKNL
ncbi:MAG TPA: hypothetical protein VHD62_06705 [Opitutaceae bacterium]|nr:hypothetical protein [Opitutaceae bacterium]